LHCGHNNTMQTKFDPEKPMGGDTEWLFKTTPHCAELFYDPLVLN